MSHDDYAVEPIPGLPENLPEGEHILWQGRPEWLSLAWRAYLVGEVVVYFGVLMAWRGFSVWWDTSAPTKAALAFFSLVPPLLAAVVILGGMAYLAARMSVYTITNRRVVFRIGIALPTTFNLPFGSIVAAHANLFGKVSQMDAGGLPVASLPAKSLGDVSLALEAGTKIAYLVLWPHARPWVLRKPEPALRCLANCAEVANILSGALHAASQHSTQTQVMTQDKLPQQAANSTVSDTQGLTVASQ